MKIVVAKWKEDTSWTEGLTDVKILDKGAGELPNVPGREAFSYIWYILNNWTKLEGKYCFCQGNPFDHSKKFLDIIKEEEVGHIADRTLYCDKFGKPAHYWEDLDIESYWKLCFGEEPMPDEFVFTEGAQFITTADNIKAVPISIWEALLQKTVEDPQSGYILERLWGYLV